MIQAPEGDNLKRPVAPQGHGSPDSLLLRIFEGQLLGFSQADDKASDAGQVDGGVDHFGDVLCDHLGPML
jgi:hypothetical protein